MSTIAFWQEKKLHEFSQQEWESVCDGCGRCCLHKLEDVDTGELHFTRIACKLLDLDTCQCSNYSNRFGLVPDCISLKQDLYQTLKWLPVTCSYRLLAEGKDLPEWHPLVSGDQLTVELCGISIKPYAISEDLAGDPQLYIIDVF